MRTTIDIPDELFRQVKLRAVHDGLRLKELLRRYVEQGLLSASTSPAPASRRNRSELPVIHIATSQPLPDLTNAELNKLMEEEDSEDANAIGNRPS